MNKIIIIGNLTREPKISKTQNDVSVCNFTVAVNGNGKDKETQFFDVKAWSNLADICDKYLYKGMKVAVDGSMERRSYTVDGETKYVWEVIATNVEFLSKRTTE
jgi:single-strand DNA-binding protein